MLDQTPKGGEAERNSTVVLTVAKEIAKAEVPDLKGKTRDDAEKALKAVNLKLGSVTETESPGAVPGTVVSQQIAAGQQLEVNKTVSISIAKASTQSAVPNFAGRTVKQYKEDLQRANLRIGIVAGPSDDNAIVVGTNPPPGTPLASGQPVDLITQQGGQQDGGNGNGGFFGGLTGGRR